MFTKQIHWKNISHQKSKHLDKLTKRTLMSQISKYVHFAYKLHLKNNLFSKIA